MAAGRGTGLRESWEEQPRSGVKTQGLNGPGLEASGWGQGIKSAGDQKGRLGAELGWGTIGIGPRL